MEQKMAIGEMTEILDFVARLSESVSEPVYVVGMVLDEEDSSFDVKILGSRKTLPMMNDLQTQASSLEADIRLFLALYSGGIMFVKADGFTIAGEGNHLIGVTGKKAAYCQLFAFIGLYRMNHKVIMTGGMQKDGDDYFYLSTKDPNDLLDFVSVGYPGLRNQIWMGAFGRDTKSLIIPKNGTSIKLVVSTDPNL